MADTGKKITANIKLRVPAGQASAGPPVGSTLGQYGLNMMEFINPFNDATSEMRGQTVTVHITIYEDRSFDWRVVSKATDERILEAAGLKKGSGKPHVDKVGNLTQDQVRQIAEDKMTDMNTDNVESAMKQVAGTARSMGITVEG